MHVYNVCTQIHKYIAGTELCSIVSQVAVLVKMSKQNSWNVCVYTHMYIYTTHTHLYIRIGV